MIACENCKHIITEDANGFYLYKCGLNKNYKNQKDACGKWEEKVNSNQEQLVETLD